MLTRRRITSYLVFIALTVPFGIAVHLIAELAGLGCRNDAELAFSSRHWYLVLLAAISLASLLGLIHAVAGVDRRRIAACIASDLPFGGGGFRFLALSFSAQFIFFVITQLGEGDPLSSGDVRIGIIAALIASMVGALSISLCKSELLAVVIELCSLLDAQMRHAGASSCCLRLDAHVRIWHLRAFTRIFSSRPPPYAP